MNNMKDKVEKYLAAQYEFTENSPKAFKLFDKLTKTEIGFKPVYSLIKKTFSMDDKEVHKYFETWLEDQYKEYKKKVKASKAASKKA